MYQCKSSVNLIGISLIALAIIVSTSIVILEGHIEAKKAEKEQLQKEKQYHEFMSQMPDNLSLALENYENMIMEYLKTCDEDSSKAEADSVVYRNIIKAQFNIKNIISQLNRAAEIQLRTKDEAFYYTMYSNGTVKGEKRVALTTPSAYGLLYRIYYDPWKEAQRKIEATSEDNSAL